MLYYFYHVTSYQFYVFLLLSLLLLIIIIHQPEIRPILGMFPLTNHDYSEVAVRPCHGRVVAVGAVGASPASGAGRAACANKDEGDIYLYRYT